MAKKKKTTKKPVSLYTRLARSGALGAKAQVASTNKRDSEKSYKRKRRSK